MAERLLISQKTSRYVSSGGARGHPDEGASFSDGGAETPRAAAALHSAVLGGNQRFCCIWTA